MLLFLTIQRQRCVKFRVLREQDLYRPLELNCQKEQHLSALEVYKNQSPIIGGSSGCTSLAPLVSPCFVLCLIGVETEGLLHYQCRAEIISILRWKFRPVIFGVHRRETLRDFRRHPELRDTLLDIPLDTFGPELLLGLVGGSQVADVNQKTRRSPEIHD